MKKTIFKPKISKIKKWYGNLKKELQERRTGLTVEGIPYIETDTGENVFADYQLFPVAGEDGLYRVEEMIMTEDGYNKKIIAKRIKSEIEKEKYLSENPIDMKNTRRMYITADYSVIKQLRTEGLQSEAGRQFCALVERQRIKKRIWEWGNKTARAIYTEGKITEPRTLGYIGGLIGKKGNIKRVYNLKDNRAKNVNKDIFESLLNSNKSLRDYYQESR